MKSLLSWIALILSVMVLAGSAFPMASEYQKGQVSFAGSPGLVDLINSDDWVYGYWVNSIDHFFYSDDTAAFNAFLARYSKLDIPTHTLNIMPGKGTEKRLDGKPMKYDWTLERDGGWISATGGWSTTEGMMTTWSDDHHVSGLSREDNNGAEGNLKSEDLKIGNGPEAKKGDTISVHYIGKFLNGKVFDSSLDRNKPFDFKLGGGQVIKGWDTGVVGMRVGGKRRLTIPPSLAYGSQEMGAIPANSTLVFEIEMLTINTPQEDPNRIADEKSISALRNSNSTRMYAASITLFTSSKVNLDKVIVPANVHISTDQCDNSDPQISRFVAKRQPPLAIYLLPEADANGLPWGSLTVSKILELNLELQNLPLRYPPLLTLDDFVSYSPKDHLLTLKQEAMDRIPEGMTMGLPFVMVAGGKRIYMGSFASSHEGPTYLPPGTPVIHTDIFRMDKKPILEIDFPSPNNTPDPRNDPAITAAFKSAGKLK